MEYSGFRAILMALLVIFILFGLLFGAAYWKYQIVLKDNPPVKMTMAPKFVTIEDGKQELNATFRVPWDKEPDGVAYVWTDGVTPVSEPQILFDAYGWGADQWTFRVVVEPVKQCIDSAGVMFVTIGDKIYSVRLPALHRIRQNELSTVQSRKWTDYAVPAIGFIAGLLILVLVIFTIRDLWRKRPVS